MAMRKKTIAICLRDMQIGGAEAVAIRMLDALLAEKKFNIVLITYVNLSVPMYRDWFRNHPEIKHYVLYPSKIFGTRLAHFFLWRLFQHAGRSIYRGLRRCAINENSFPDVDIFIDFYDFGFYPELRKINRPKIAWWHSSITKFMNGDYAQYLADYDRFVMLTNGAMTEVQSKYPSVADKVLRIYNPIDISGVRTRAADAPMGVRGKYFCAVARLSRDKDIETILRAFDMFWNNAGQPDVKMVFVGDGDRADDFKALAASLSAANQFVFAGMQSNPFGYMKGAIAHILSSHSEGLPTVLIEASAVSTLNIASDCRNGPCEILMDGAGGMLFTPGDAVGLAQCMIDAWENPSQMAKKIEKATDGLIRFDVKTIVPQINDLISGLK